MAEASGRKELPRELSRVLARFETWRRKRPSRRTRIPQSLWDAAVEVSARSGISQTARVLRLNEQELRRRSAGAGIGQVTSGVRDGSRRSVGFIELVPAAAPPSALSWVVELESPVGARLRIEGRGEGELDVASLAAAFLRVSS